MRAGGISGNGRAPPLEVLMLCDMLDGLADVGTGGGPKSFLAAVEPLAA
jgi:hypothetical protein